MIRKTLRCLKSLWAIGHRSILHCFLSPREHISKLLFSLTQLLNRALTLKAIVSEGDFNKAIELYSAAIDLNPNVAVYYSNRSISYLKTECYGYALSDATKAIELDKSYIKGYYRRAAAHMCLGKFKLALRDFEAVSHVIFWLTKAL